MSINDYILKADPTSPLDVKYEKLLKNDFLESTHLARTIPWTLPGLNETNPDMMEGLGVVFHTLEPKILKNIVLFINGYHGTVCVALYRNNKDSASDPSESDSLNIWGSQLIASKSINIDEYSSFQHIKVSDLVYEAGVNDRRLWGSFYVVLTKTATVDPNHEPKIRCDVMDSLVYDISIDQNDYLFSFRCFEAYNISTNKPSDSIGSTEGSATIPYIKVNLVDA